MKRISTLILASMLAVAPTVAVAQANPAAGLSVAKRAATVSAQKDRLAGGGILIALLAAAAVVAGIVIVADSDDDADSN